MIKTRFKHIHFVKQEMLTVPPGQKAGYIIRNNSTNNEMGVVEWYPRWRQWVAAFEDSHIWSHDCLADVREFIVALNGWNGAT